MLSENIQIKSIKMSRINIFFSPIKIGEIILNSAQLLFIDNNLLFQEIFSVKPEIVPFDQPYK